MTDSRLTIQFTTDQEWMNFAGNIANAQLCVLEYMQANGSDKASEQAYNTLRRMLHIEKPAADSVGPAVKVDFLDADDIKDYIQDIVQAQHIIYETEQETGTTASLLYTKAILSWLIGQVAENQLNQ
ncbi:hypothetical protein KIH41_07165 [Litoribacter ruber]|uniref:hypothetical protein n=1 Tax=Litoribacter ruber TaxID=702568 RepID=UPI001BD997C8|nr:hypothetical protein [Litoribacter ruber]MBT0811058.1 hypothetical protein [Litoribacter ruber]